MTYAPKIIDRAWKNLKSRPSWGQHISTFKYVIFSLRHASKPVRFYSMVTPRDGVANGSETRDPGDRVREQDGSRRGRILPSPTHPGASLGC